MRVARSYRRKPRRFPWKGFWVLVLLAEILAAPFTSPWTGLRKVDVRGAEARDRHWIENALRPHAGTPVLLLDLRAIERPILKEPRVSEVHSARGLDGRLTLRLTYRKPFARWQGPNWSLDVDEEGVPFRKSPGLLPYRLVSYRQKPPPLGKPVATLKTPLYILRYVRDTGLAKQATVIVDRTGKICLNMPASAPVELGSAENVSKKLETLRSVLKRDPRLLKKVEYLDLKYPGAPAVKTKRPESDDAGKAAEKAAQNESLRKTDPTQ